MRGGVMGLAALLALLAGPVWSQEAPDPPAPSAGPVRTPAQVTHRPSAAEGKPLFPAAALKAGKSGSVEVTCEIDADGVSHDCQLTAEEPKGLGYGEAGLRLAALYRFAPATIDGKPVPSKMRLSFPFTVLPPAEPPAATSEPRPPKIAAKPKVTWPDSSMSERNYPRRALEEEVSGRAEVVCDVYATGQTRNCRLASETPAGYGFGEAALKLAYNTRLEFVDDQGRGVARTDVTIPFNFALKGAKEAGKVQSAPKPPAVRSPAGALVPGGFTLALLAAMIWALFAPMPRRRQFHDY